MEQASRTRRGRVRSLVLGLSGLLAVTFALLLLQMAPTGGGSTVHATDLECPVPVDVSLVMDHSGSMGTPASKLTNAKAAAKGFIDQLAGGPLDNDLTPHEMALTSFTNGNASTNVPLTTNAATLRSTINGFGANGFTQIGRALALGQLQLEPPIEPDLPTDANDYMVLLSDGSANEPQDIDLPNDSSSFNDLYIDVNDNGYIDTGDDFSLDYTGGGVDINIVDGLLVVNNSADRINLLDTNEDSVQNNSDDFNFGAGYNFRIIDSTLYVDANGDGNFTVDPANLSGTPAFVSGHNDELMVLRNGMVWANDANFSGDGSDVYAYYWGTQTKTAGTKIFVLGYDIGVDQDTALMQLISSGPGFYFGGNPSNVSSIFTSIAQAICGFSLSKVRTSAAQALPGDKVTFEIQLLNSGSVDLQNVNMHDDYDPTQLAFVSANPVPTSTNFLTGDLDWTNLAHDSPDGNPTVWEPGRTLTITLSFTALLPIASADNCANLTSNPVSSPSTIIAAGPSCDSVSIVTATPTQTPITPIPTSTPTSTSTVTSTPTNTPTDTPTNTPVTPTATNTPVTPTATTCVIYCPTPTPTTCVIYCATATNTNTPLPTVGPQGTQTPTATICIDCPVGGVSADPPGGGSAGGGSSAWLIALSTAIGLVLSLPVAFAVRHRRHRDL